MARKPAARQGRARRGGRLRRVGRWLGRAALLLVLLPIVLIALYRIVPPPTTPTIMAASWRLGGVSRQWVALEDVAPAARRAIVAAEDANFCLHWGFDMAALRAAIEAGARRGASTISQQTVKNLLLWQGRSWPRKAIEAALTPLAEALWPKRRILELYLNVAEFGPGIFGIEAAAQRYFGIPASALDARRAGRLAMVLPAPKRRTPDALSPALARRARSVAAGAALIAEDGRAECFDH